jgi:hypothetical protein
MNGSKLIWIKAPAERLQYRVAHPTHYDLDYFDSAGIE